MAKLKLALYWAASCGGCEIAQLQIGDKILKLAEVADIVFWPVAIDVKYKDVEAMPSKSIDVCLFNGGIRTSEQEHKQVQSDDCLWCLCLRRWCSRVRKLVQPGEDF